jgi:hypothetical protein
MTATVSLAIAIFRAVARFAGLSRRPDSNRGPLHYE